MPYAGKATATKPEVVDSATAGPGTEKSDPTVENPTKGASGGNRKRSGKPNSGKGKTESTPSSSTPGFAEGTAALLSYGMSTSGYRERVLSPFKTEKFFHMVNASYQRLLNVKPSLPSRFTYEEFLHCSALQLYQRIENVKFDALGVKPSAPTRVPLPRNLRVFQPLWSTLANIGTVDDEDLRVQYIPDAILPDSANLDSDHDIEGLLSCTMFDWKTNWNLVLAARENRPSFHMRDSYITEAASNESPEATKANLIKRIAETKRRATYVRESLEDDIAIVKNNAVYFFPETTELEYSALDSNGKRKNPDIIEVNGKFYDQSVSDETLKKRPSYKTEEAYLIEIERLFEVARNAKRERITPRFSVEYQSSSYKISDGTVTSDPGAYGSRLHWDPQLWLDYENFVNEVASIAMFSLSMPVETKGTYAWVLPVEKRSDNDSAFFVKMPKASIPTQTWVLAMLIQSSTLPLHRRSTWYTETDSLSNLIGLRNRYINAAIKTAAPVEQYGTI